MEKISLEFIPIRSNEILARNNPGQTISLMNLHDINNLYMIDAIAADIWSLIDDQSSLQMIAQKIIKKHNPPKEQFHKDLISFVQQLKEEKILM